jgi:hypothetical protein
MLISQQAQGGMPQPNGSAPGHLAELRRQLADPSSVSDGSRQRLRELARRLTRVRALGGEYGRVGFSDSARTALAQGGPSGGASGGVAVA